MKNQNVKTSKPNLETKKSIPCKHADRHYTVGKNKEPVVMYQHQH